MAAVIGVKQENPLETRCTIFGAVNVQGNVDFELESGQEARWEEA
jgi:hypothetical protein